MRRNKDIEAGARDVAADFKLPGGRRKKLAKLLKDNWSWFDAAEARGMAAEDMLHTLTNAGATYEDGSSIKLSTLANALWRRRQAGPVETTHKPAARPRQSNKKDGKRRAGKAPGASQPVSRRRAPRAQHLSDDLGSGRSIGSGPAASGAANKQPRALASAKGAKASPTDVLSYMRRAAAIRRPSKDRD